VKNLPPFCQVMRGCGGFQSIIVITLSITAISLSITISASHSTSIQMFTKGHKNTEFFIFVLAIPAFSYSVLYYCYYFFLYRLKLDFARIARTRHCKPLILKTLTIPSKQFYLGICWDLPGQLYKHQKKGQFLSCYLEPVPSISMRN